MLLEGCDLYLCFYRMNLIFIGLCKRCLRMKILKSNLLMPGQYFSPTHQHFFASSVLHVFDFFIGPKIYKLDLASH